MAKDLLNYLYERKNDFCTIDEISRDLKIPTKSVESLLDDSKICFDQTTNSKGFGDNRYAAVKINKVGIMKIEGFPHRSL